MKHAESGGESAAKAEGASLRRLMPMLRYLRPYRLPIALAFTMIVLTTGAMLSLGGVLRYLVDSGLARGDARLLDRAYGLMLGVLLLLAGATYCRYFLIAWLGERVVADIREDLYRHLIAMDIGFFETARTGDLLSRLTTDTTLLQTILTTSVAIAVRNLLLLAGGFTLLLLTSAQLTAYVLLMVPLVVVPILVVGRRVRSLSRLAQAKVAELNAHAEETLSGIRTVQAMTMEEMEKRRFAAHVKAAADTALDRIRTRAGLTALVIALVLGAVATVLWIGGHEVMKGGITPGDLSAFVFYSVIVAGAVGVISEVAADLQRAAGAGERLEEALSWQPAIVAPPDPLPLSDDATLTLDTLTFAYPSRLDQPALTGVSLTVAPGEMVALVGPSGAGKTTIFQLILRFYDPASGHIFLGGADIRRLDPAPLRRAVGLVPQEPVIFSADALTNIRAGRPDATDDEVIAAARAASALEFLEKLPQGLRTPLGEKGVRLSGGQRQRLAIARAVVRDPRILLLDEATSSLDAENERLVQEALSRLMHGRATLVIAHRLSTVMHADRIVFLQEGRIEAVGTHAQLLAHPAYARLAALQFQRGE